MASKLPSLVVALGLNTENFQANLQRATLDITRFSSNVQSRVTRNINQMNRDVLNSIKQIGIGVTAMGLGIGAVLGSSVNVAADFEYAVARVGAISGATEEELAKLTETARQLGRDTAYTATEAAQAMQSLSMAGFKVSETISAMPGLLDMAAAGQVALAETADIASNVLRAYGIEASEMNRVADVLTKTFVTSNTTLETLGQTMKYVGPVARAAGVSLEQVAAAAGILGDVGIKADMAGTALRNIFLRLSTEPSAVVKTMKALGISIEDANGKILPFPDIIQRIADATANATDKQKLAVAAYLAGARGAPAMLALLDAGPEKLREYTKELENSTGKAAEIAKKQLDNYKGSLKIFSSSIEDLQISIGNTFLPLLNNIVKGLTVLANAFGSLPEWVKSTITVIVALGAGLLITGGIFMIFVGYFAKLAASFLWVTANAPLLMTWLTRLTTPIRAIILLFTSLGSVVLPMLTAAVTALGRAMLAFLLTPQGLIVAAIAILITIGYQLLKHWDDVKKIGMAVWNGIKSIIIGTVNAIDARFSGFKSFMVAAWNYITKPIQPLIDALGWLFKKIDKGIEWVRGKLGLLEEKKKVEVDPAKIDSAKIKAQELKVQKDKLAENKTPIPVDSSQLEHAAYTSEQLKDRLDGIGIEQVEIKVDDKELAKINYEESQKASKEAYEAEKEMIEKSIDLAKKARDEKVEAAKDYADKQKDYYDQIYEKAKDSYAKIIEAAELSRDGDLAALQGQLDSIDAEEKKRDQDAERSRLQKAIDEAETAEDKAKAIAELAEWTRKQEVDKNKESIRSQMDTVRNSFEQKKKLAENSLAEAEKIHKADTNALETETDIKIEKIESSYEIETNLANENLERIKKTYEEQELAAKEAYEAITESVNERYDNEKDKIDELKGELGVKTKDADNEDKSPDNSAKDKNTVTYADAIVALVGMMADTVKATVDYFTEAWQGFKVFFTDLWESMLEPMRATADYFEDVWNGFGDFFIGLWEGMWEPIKSVLNVMIEGINYVIDGLNTISVSTPDWDILPNSIQNKTWGVNIANIPVLHGGGIFKAPFGQVEGLALLANGERVIPEGESTAQTVNHTGTIRVEGVNNQNQLMGAVDIIMDQLRREVRI